VPRDVLELGPGASIGTGMAALLGGAERYVAIDKVDYTTRQANLESFRGLVDLFRRRAPRPTAGFPSFDEFLDERLFPAHILTQERLAAALAPGRIERLERAIEALGTPKPDPRIRYHTWQDAGQIEEGGHDLVFSHVVLNHVEDLERVYGLCARWLRPGGWMSHQIDFTSLGTTPEWNGHRRYGDLSWKMLAGRRAYFVNREVFGHHLELMREQGFEVVCAIRGARAGGLPREAHAPRWRALSDEELSTQTGFVIARKR